MAQPSLMEKMFAHVLLQRVVASLRKAGCLERLEWQKRIVTFRFSFNGRCKGILMHLKMPRTYYDYHKKKLNKQENFESWSVFEDT